MNEETYWTVPADMLGEMMHVDDVAGVMGIDRDDVEHEVAAGRLPSPEPGEPRRWRTVDVLRATTESRTDDLRVR